MDKIIDLEEGAVNVYRTKNFIVKQCLYLHKNDIEGNNLISFDTFTFRTAPRDLAYLAEYMNRKNLNGKRIPSTTYTRKYIY